MFIVAFRIDNFRLRRITMKLKYFFSIILLSCLLTAYSCNSDDSKVSVQDIKQSSSHGRLLFFLNPNGNPCQEQDRILDTLKQEISSKVQIQKIYTTIPEDRSYFYQYGIRSLPILILVDSKDNVIQRFSPGIKNKNTIMEYITNCKCS
jgi:hypothetical protein